MSPSPEVAMGGGSLYERLGGEAAIMAAVDRFYEKVLGDSLTGPYFAELDVKAQTTKQVAFMTWAFGGPETWKGRDLRTAHAPLVRRGLGPAHFEAIVRHLEETLRELGIGEDLIDEVSAVLASTRREVLGG
jgi:hemoglobin